MLYINGVPYYSTKDIKSRANYAAFTSAATAYGWQHESLGQWCGAEIGNGKMTIDQWLTSQKMWRTSQLVKATGFCRQYLTKTAKANGITVASTLKGRWPNEAVVRLLDALDMRAICPKCEGLAVRRRDGAVRCLECEA